MASQNCSLDSISEYSPTAVKPWNLQRIQHLYRRTGFGTDFNSLQYGLTQNPIDVVDAIIDEAQSVPIMVDPGWGEWSISDYSSLEIQGEEQTWQMLTQFYVDMLDNGMKGKLTLFWSNHFVTRQLDYGCPAYLFQYYRTLQQHAMGNFREFVRAIGLTPAMLVFLNGNYNSLQAPNENYARELFELFTLGENNGYTQDDVVQTSIALTGWTDVSEFCAPIGFDDLDHSHGMKTIFGQVGDFDYNDIVDLLFSQRGDLVAYFICEKLYRYFVSPSVDQGVVNALASEFISSDFELIPVYKMLFKSEHFFDEHLFGVKVKSPLDLLLNISTEAHLTVDATFAQAFHGISTSLGQSIFNPVDVAGWQGNHNWINSSTLSARWQAIEFMVNNELNSAPNNLITFAQSIGGGPQAYEPAIVTEKILDFLIPVGLQSAAEYQYATTVFKWDVPQNYYDNNEWNLSWNTVPDQVAALLSYIGKLPEFQLT